MPNQNTPSHRVTSFEVAERAGVNQSTVSRALSGDSSITDATREKVRRAADELGYRVDARAARLRSGKTRTLAIVVITKPDIEATQINPFHYNLLGSVCAAASEKGYQSLVSFQSVEEQFYGDFVETRQADGVILIGTSTNDAAWAHHRALLEREDVASWGSPYVDHRRVDSDNRAGARMAVERLLAAGHRDLVFIGDTRQTQPQFRERFASFSDATREAGIDGGKAIFEDGETRGQQGRRSARTLIDSGRGFDGIFCSCDAMAFGALEVLRESGVDVPRDVGVIGFDGLGSGAHSSPPLTTVEPDFARAGVLLVDTALGLTKSGERRRAPVRLVERASVRTAT
ncbi:LacI family DNA-binding transcriptional regulator [Aurantiacibacter sediminis]|uniref:LacI family DNA-binding transcriptional regulator n=1 Tax=Aurantiacibacter sediminis TaxID=2793064 RepID=A0ABS0N580_9SPHN|nr:LacI family DNA-binding transcriptional regulator [Aurantiacibacter sediminis]MBH5322953.1 LacI family DNA-binding transcriptional regulator [Aurantiacibacter sediminis]